MAESIPMSHPLVRAHYLLRTVEQFISENPVNDFTVFYDGATCDDMCLKIDCAFAADDLEVELAKMGIKL